MTASLRLRSAIRASLWHFLGSLTIAASVAAIVFFVWFPYPYSELSGGKELFLLVVSVDIVCGPLLTLVVFSPTKPRSELWRDLGIIAALQIAALGYGVNSVMQARPVFLAFESNRFRVVAVPDIPMDQMEQALPQFRSLSLSGPLLIGTRLSSPSDPDYLASVKLALEGLHPAQRPSRWVPYSTQRLAVKQAAKPIAGLRAKHRSESQLIDRALQEAGLQEESAGYLPLVTSKRDDWSALVDLDTGEPVAYLPLLAW